MPKKTFHNLKQEKQDQLVNAFLREFTIHTYDHASISQVLKKLGMAKGSFYQYFENKQDVFMYLVSYALGKKMGYIEHVKRDDFENFWDYWRAIYKEGLEFDRECPAQSNFGYHLMDNINSPSMKEMSNSFYQQGVEGMKSMIEPEVKSGAFRKDLSLEKLAFFLMKTGEHLLDYMKLYQTKMARHI